MAQIVYELSMPGDCEGRSTHVVGLFRSEVAAKAIGKSGEGNRGMGPCDGYIKEVLVYDSVNDFQVSVDNLVRARALAKLTDEEKRALGLMQ
mgnify:CR=1 FL=1